MSARGRMVAGFPEIVLDTCAFPPSPFLQLPVEILQQVFLFLAGRYPPRFLNSSGQPDWIAVTYVCRYWRSAALDLLKLWSSITPGLSISWSRAMMERSAPLSMHIDMRIGACYKHRLKLLAVLELLTTASRIRTLRLSGYPNYILSVFHGLRKPSPLESLNLEMVPDGRSIAVSLPVALFGGEAPYCRRLTFETSVCIQAPRWLLAGITHLTTSANVTLHALLCALQATPQLEVLCIARIPDRWHDTDTPEGVPPPRPALPRLSLLSLCDMTPCHLVNLSRHIDAPSTLRRHLSWRLSVIGSWDLWASMLAAMRTFVPRDFAPGTKDGDLRSMRVMGEPESGSLEVWSRTGSERAGASEAAREGALFLLRIDWHRIPAFSWDDLFFHLATLCAHLHTACVEALVVAPEATIESSGATDERTTDAPYVATKWQALLSALPSVNTLHLHRGSSACFSVLRALSASAGLLPHLQRVFVVHSIVQYAAAAHLDGTGVADSGSGSAVASREFVRENLGAELVDSVKGRSGLEVVLVRCEVDDEELDALRKLVICDEWADV